jgi:hypothetical protein
MLWREIWAFGVDLVVEAAWTFVALWTTRGLLLWVFTKPAERGEEEIEVERGEEEESNAERSDSEDSAVADLRASRSLWTNYADEASDSSSGGTPHGDTFGFNQEGAEFLSN